MKVQIISVGSPSKGPLNELISKYEARLLSSVKVTWCYVQHGATETKTSIQKESEKILKLIPDKSYVILLDERGAILTSEEFSNLIYKTSKPITIIIGGAYGVNDDVRSRADFTMSLSKLVFPHQIVRLILAEQIYRAQAVHSNHPYHHA